jgi:cytochrome c oxidase subunit IV
MNQTWGLVCIYDTCAKLLKIFGKYDNGIRWSLYIYIYIVEDFIGFNLSSLENVKMQTYNFVV